MGKEALRSTLKHIRIRAGLASEEVDDEDSDTDEGKTDEIVPEKSTIPQDSAESAPARIVLRTGGRERHLKGVRMNAITKKA